MLILFFLSLKDLQWAAVEDVDLAVDSAERGLKEWQTLSPVCSMSSSQSNIT